MAHCCTYQIIPFTNAGVVNIAYSVAMRSQYGKVPHVKVWIKDGSEYIEALLSIRLTGNPTTNIRVDNGGIASGFVKIFR
jgi:hypothetical protein